MSLKGLIQGYQTRFQTDWVDIPVIPVLRVNICVFGMVVFPPILHEGWCLCWHWFSGTSVTIPSSVWPSCDSSTTLDGNWACAPSMHPPSVYSGETKKFDRIKHLQTLRLLRLPSISEIGYPTGTSVVRTGCRSASTTDLGFKNKANSALVDIPGECLLAWDLCGVLLLICIVVHPDFTWRLWCSRRPRRRTPLGSKHTERWVD